MIKVLGLVNTAMKDFLPITGAYISWNLIWKLEKYPLISSMNLSGKLFLTISLKSLLFIIRQKKPLA